MRKLFLSIIALTLGIGTWAQETQSVNYIDADGQQQTVTATVVTDETETLSAGWYVVTGEVSRGSITCNGDVHLILADGAKLTAQGDNTSQTPGVQVSGEGNSLAIYGQAAQSGQLIATGGRYAAGIGGGYHSSGSNITINGGTVTANGEYLGAGIGGGNGGSGSNITINGGTVTATGKNGAGIGGGFIGSGSNITINGGSVYATGESDAAGIGGGGGGSGSYITINGGSVCATGESNAAGIGGGSNGSGSYITINGGSVDAIGKSGAAGIGGGWLGSGSYITINGGTVTANGEHWGAGIGGGGESSGSYITINGGTVTAAGIGGGSNGSGSYIFIATNYIVKADNNNPPTTVILNDGTDLADKLAGKHYVTVESDPLFDVKAAAIELIQTARQGIQNDEINTIIDNGVDAIRMATTEQQVEDIKREMMTVITCIQIGKAEALGPLGTPHPGPAVKVTKGDTEVILYLPDKVEYIIRK